MPRENKKAAHRRGNDGSGMFDDFARVIDESAARGGKMSPADKARITRKRNAPIKRKLKKIEAIATDLRDNDNVREVAKRMAVRLSRTLAARR